MHDENHAYFVAFSKNKKLDKSAVKKLRYRTKKKFCTPALQTRAPENFHSCRWGDERTVKREQTGSEDPHRRERN
jgi:hypothetical protein